MEGYFLFLIEIQMSFLQQASYDLGLFPETGAEMEDHDESWRKIVREERAIPGSQNPPE